VQHYFTKHRIAVLFISAILLLTSGCGFNLRGITQVPLELQTMLVESNDPYGPVTRSIEQQLRLNGIQIEENHSRTDIPTLSILSYSESKDTASIFRDGKTAEHQMILTVSAQVIMPGKQIYPISVAVQRTFFDNPLSALAKDAEQELIIKEMREQAAQKIVRKLLTVNNAAAGSQTAASNAQ
jgi:LPS-assembly lipoprotein